MVLPKARATWLGGYATRLNDTRGHPVVVDLPLEEEGRDAGTSALELLVLSLAGCVTTIFALVAEKRRLRFQAMELELESVRPQGAPTIERVTGTFRLTTDADPEEVETALRRTIAICPVGVVFARAGIPVDVRTEVHSPSPAAPPEPPRVPVASPA
jgi:putative redox protein